MANLVDLVEQDFGITGNTNWKRSEVHSSLVVDEEKQLFYFNSRGIQGNAFTYLTKVRGLDAKSAHEILRYSTAGMPIDTKSTSIQYKFEKLVDLFHSSSRKDREYWYDRKLTDATIDRYRLGNYEGWNLIPIYDNGRFINFQCRRDKPEKRIKFWYKDDDFKPVLFNKDILTYVKKAYVVEGMVDCILLNQLGFPCVCSTNGAMSWNSSWIEYFRNIEEVIYIADNDSAGVRAAKLVANSLGLYKVRVLRFKDERPKYGAMDYFRAGGDVDSFKSIIEERSVMGMEGSMI